MSSLPVAMLLVGPPLPNRMRVRSQTKRDTVVLQVGGWGVGPALQHSQKYPLAKNHIPKPWNQKIYIVFFFLWPCDPMRVMASSFLSFLDHTRRRTTVSRTPLDKWSARRRDLYLTTHNTHNRQTSMPPVGFEPTISVGERPQTYALDRAVTGTGTLCMYIY